jgi:uncharacterized membrane protein
LTLEKLIAIFVLAASPIGEILIAIPFGVALGVDPFLSFLVSYIANILPCALLLILLEEIQKRFPRFFNFFSKRADKTLKKANPHLLSFAVVFITPILGVYATSLGTQIIGLTRMRSFALQATGVFVYGISETLLIFFGIHLFKFS